VGTNSVPGEAEVTAEVVDSFALGEGEERFLDCELHEDIKATEKTKTIDIIFRLNEFFIK
jgi:hypothetical protein